MKVLGLDLSLRHTGIALPDGTLDTISIRAGVVGMERLAVIRDVILGAIITDRVDLVAVEGYSYNSGQGAHQLGELGGVIRLALAEQGSGVPYVDVPPASLKRYATGKGNASKDEVLVAAVKRLGVEPTDNNQADAAWLRVAALDAYGQYTSLMPQSHRKALEAVTWPELARWSA